MGRRAIYSNGECENCGHYVIDDGLKDGVCGECREAYPEDYPDEDEDRDCPKCQGTGIGRHGDPDTSKCGKCGGRGYMLPGKSDDELAAAFDRYRDKMKDGDA